ncbi:MAG: zinc ribbon domain-containing protein, partial [Deltaproteobacteria bacterium]|nr:zinc ribbon domain-containing protein [Deltaproteobacteria bacterium]
KIARLISPTAFVLKGGGWYKDGYSSSRGKSANSAEGGAKETAKTDAAPTCERTGKQADAGCACAGAAPNKS